jgi:hypothetical protein
MADIIVALFDPTLPYNSTNNVDLSSYRTNQLSYEYSLNRGDTIFTIGNIDSIGNNVSISGDVMNEEYYGASLDKTFFLGEPDSILINIQSGYGLSGAAVWIGDPESTDGNVTCVGMINSKINTPNNTSTYTEAIQTKIMINIITNIIQKWEYYNSAPKISGNDILTSYLLKLSNQKIWFGTICTYFNSSISVAKFPILNNLPYTGGLIVEDFILGFNLIDKIFITDVMKLGEFSAIELKTPLLKTKMYDIFIESSRSPIVIKSFQYFTKIL